MAYIKVNHTQIRVTAKEIDQYISLVRVKMTSAAKEVADLQTYWQGADMEAFLQELSNKYMAPLMHKDRTIPELAAYRDHLYQVAALFQEAQEDAIDLATNLPK